MHGERAFAAAGLSGALLALSFPTFGHPASAWVACIPLLIALHDIKSVRRAFWLGLTTGAVYFGGTLPWLTAVMVSFAGFPQLLGVLINGLLVAYLALFPAAFAVMVVVLCRRLGSLGLLGAAPLWLTTELGRLWILGGFPWELIGYSQTDVLPVAQLASLFGVHGITLLVLFVNSVLALALVGPARYRLRALASAGGVVVVVVAFGMARLADNRLVQAGDPLRVGLIQGNIPQDQKWDGDREAQILTRYSELSRQSTAAGAQLVVWPESATPFSFESHPASEEIRRLARDASVDLVFGSTQLRLEPEFQLFNAAFALNQSGETSAVYHKMHLVPFGEYVPFRSLLSFVGPLVEAVGPFSPGLRANTIPVGSHQVSVAICYEVIYPALIRDFVRNGSELLVAITNDAWYERSAAPHQHFQQAAMRAIEQGRYLVRAANTGISGVVDPYGRVVRRSELFVTTVVTEDVRLLTQLTFYGQVGDLPAYLCLVLTAVAMVVARRPRATRGSP